MKIVILGAGVIGVATAWYLAESGHEVTVVDRRDSVARETSFANAGLISPGHAYAWASPRAPWILLKSLYRSDTALRFHLRADPAHVELEPALPRQLHGRAQPAQHRSSS